MNKQRGLAMIAIYAIVALGLVAGLLGWWEYHNYTVRKAERDKWQAAMKVCTENTETAVNANKTLQASAEQVIAKVKEQNAAIDALTKAEAVARAARDTAVAAALQRERLLRTQINQLTVIANAPAAPPSLAVCDEGAEILRAYAREP
jgi:Tfp pilus assembly protein PilV